MKKSLALAATSLLLLSVTACTGGTAAEAPAGGSDSQQPSSVAGQSSPAALASSDPSTSAPAEAPLDLSGTWTEVDGAPDGYQEAVITDTAIEINWVSDGGKTESLYWAGTFKAPASGEAFEVTSKNDAEKTSVAMLASPDPTKVFAYADGVLSYKVSALGTTKTVELKRK